MKSTRPILAIVMSLLPLFFVYCAQPSTGVTPTTSPSALPPVVADPPQVNFFTKPGASPPGEEIRLKTESGSGSFDWSMNVNRAWLSVSPKKGTVPAGWGAATVSVDAGRLAAGEYKGTISVHVQGMADRDITVRLYVTGSKVGDVLWPQVEPGEGSAWSRGITLDGPTATSVDGLGEFMFSSGADGEMLFYGAGDMVILLNGIMKNESDKDWRTEYWARGFDGEGNQVSWTLDSLGVPGRAQGDISSHSSTPFTLHLTWADNVQLIKIDALCYEPPEAFFPATQIPESEIARIRFSEKWLMAYDMELDPIQVKITFPRSWLQDSPPLAVGDKAVELIVPYQLLFEHNESKDPEMIAVSFPVWYFKGLSTAPTSHVR